MNYFITRGAVSNKKDYYNFNIIQIIYYKIKLPKIDIIIYLEIRLVTNNQPFKYV